MIKLKVFSIFLLCSLFLVGGASAVPLDITYTGDNVVTQFSVWDGSWDDELLGSNAGNWKSADTSTIHVTPGETYEFAFIVDNLGAPGSENPGGFLAQLAINGTTFVTDSSWYVYDDDVWANPFANSAFATEYGANSDSSTIWYRNNAGPISGISGDAQWIWWDPNYGPDSPTTVSLFTKITMPEPVPEPATMLLLGSGLVGLVGLGRKKFRKK